MAEVQAAAFEAEEQAGIAGAEVQPAGVHEGEGGWPGTHGGLVSAQG